MVQGEWQRLRKGTMTRRCRRTSSRVTSRRICSARRVKALRTPGDKARIPSEEELRQITTRAVADIIPRDEFVAALKSGRALRLKMGFDPSAPDLTLGHAVGLRKLRQLQDLGHTIVVIVGDWTARIGDPSGQSKTRPMLTADEVKANAETYLRQFSKIVDRELTEVRWQSEWFDEFTLTTVVSLAAKFTVAQMLEREDFAQRFSTQKPIGIHELFYPLLQAYDSVAVQADVEFGGTDQTFNLLVGRELQPEFEQPRAVRVHRPAARGHRRREDEQEPGQLHRPERPAARYVRQGYVDYGPAGGRLLRAADRRAGRRDRGQSARRWRRAAPAPATRRCVWRARSSRSSTASRRRTRRRRSSAASLARGETPEEASELPLAFNGAAAVEVDLAEALVSAGLAESKSEVRRLLSQGAVESDGQRVTGPRMSVRKDTVIRVGKHRFVRVVDAG